MLKKSALFLILLLATGCARELIPINHGELVTLGPKEGLLLLAIDSEEELHEVVINGKRWRKLSQEIVNGSDYFLVALPRGEYEFSECSAIYPKEIAPEVGPPYGTWTPSEDENRDWKFRVEAGKINYAGHYRIMEISRGTYSGRYYAAYEASNRSSFAYSYVKKYHPAQFAQYEMVYTGFGEDGFFDEIKKIEKSKGVAK